ncbi:MAG: DUF4846 domain-containing protein [Parafilimonas sp.]
MRSWFIIAASALYFNCSNTTVEKNSLYDLYKKQITADTFPKNSWQYFLQHLPATNAPIKDYTGKLINNQSKHIAVINYDVGTSDLQQCADALMRLRAEYLFTQNRFNDIGFHFCSGQYYSWNMYCKGMKPLLKNNAVSIIATNTFHKTTHESLRNYLDIVYAYANTISLCKELKPADDFEVGTVIITPGSPGHTCMIIDERINEKGEKLYKLAEGYMPAQSIYILSNPYDESISPWYKLTKGEILTASYDFTNYKLKKFE